MLYFIESIVYPSIEFELQKVDEIVTQRRFSRFTSPAAGSADATGSAAKAPPATATKAATATATKAVTAATLKGTKSSVSAKEAVKKALRMADQTATAAGRQLPKDATKVSVSFKGSVDDDNDGVVTMKEQLDESLSLQAALDKLLKDSAAFSGWTSLEMRFPLPRRLLTKKSSELKRFLQNLFLESISLSMQPICECMCVSQLFVKPRRRRENYQHILPADQVS